MSDTIEGIHIVTNPKGTGWVNEANGVIVTKHRTKAVAIATGRLMAKRHGTQFTIHRKDGTEITTRSYAISPLE